MRVLDSDQFLVRIFLGDSDRWRHTPLSRALLPPGGLGCSARGYCLAGRRA
jgi:hypothetical protein